MPWNYRVVRHPGNWPEEDDPDTRWYAIHLAFYEDGTPPAGKPDSLSAHPVFPDGTAPDDLRADLERMQRALTMPVLDFDTREPVT